MAINVIFCYLTFHTVKHWTTKTHSTPVQNQKYCCFKCILTNSSKYPIFECRLEDCVVGSWCVSFYEDYHLCSLSCRCFKWAHESNHNWAKLISKQNQQSKHTNWNQTADSWKRFIFILENKMNEFHLSILVSSLFICVHSVCQYGQYVSFLFQFMHLMMIV